MLNKLGFQSIWLRFELLRFMRFFYYTILISRSDVGNVVLSFHMSCSIQIGEPSCDKNRRSVETNRSAEVTFEYSVDPNQLAYNIEEGMVFVSDSSASLLKTSAVLSLIVSLMTL